MAKIGFLGTGLMGTGMAANLIKAGHEVHVYNRTVEKARPLVEAGATLALTPRDAADGAEAVFAMVGDDEASESMWMGADGALNADLPAGAFAVECSTLSHDWVMKLAGYCADTGLTYVDCPVTGHPHVAAAGELTLFVGADDDVLDAARPFLEAVSKEIIHFGPTGAGTAYKLMVNLMGSVQIAAIAEGLLMVEKAGLDWDTVNYALAKGAAASPQVVFNAERMAAGQHTESIVFPGYWRLKDTRYGVELARKFGQATRFGETALKIYEELVESGNGDVNETKVIDYLRS